MHYGDVERQQCVGHYLKPGQCTDPYYLVIAHPELGHVRVSLYTGALDKIDPMCGYWLMHTTLHVEKQETRMTGAPCMGQITMCKVLRKEGGACIFMPATVITAEDGLHFNIETGQQEFVACPYTRCV